jgi:hypothetical protein
MALCTADQARDLIPGLAGTAQATLLASLCDRASEVIALWCGYGPASAGAAATMEGTTYTEYLDGPVLDEPRALRLPHRPIVSVTSIHDDASWSYGSDSLVSSGGYTIDGTAGIVWATPSGGHSWSRGRRNIRAVYVAGFVTVPGGLVQACALLVGHWYRLASRQGLTGGSGANRGASFGPETIPEPVREMLQPYRIGRGLL